MDTSCQATDTRESSKEDAARLLVEASYDDDSFEQLLRQVLVQVLQDETNIHLTYESIIIRFLQRTAEFYHVPWSTVLETTSHVYIDSKLQQRLLQWWNQRTKVFTLEEQHCIERILGRDHVRVTDLIKFAGCAHKVIPTKRQLWWWFGMCGFFGDDAKRYVESTFRSDVMSKHVEAVRTLLDMFPEKTLDQLKETIEAIFRGEQHEARDVYLDIIGGREAAKQVAEWIENKRKKVEGETNRKRSKVSSSKESNSKKAKKEQQVEVVIPEEDEASSEESNG